MNFDEAMELVKVEDATGVAMPSRCVLCGRPAVVVRVAAPWAGLGLFARPYALCGKHPADAPETLDRVDAIVMREFRELIAKLRRMGTDPRPSERGGR